MPLDPTVEYIEIEVNETNIDRYDMPKRFDQSREELLSRAAEARAPQEGAPDGFTLSVKIPKEETLTHNVFDNFRDEHVDPKRFTHCGYELREMEDGGHIHVCVLHGKTSNYNVEENPTAPCIQVDPAAAPSKEEVREAMQKALGCRYEGKLDGIRGTVYTCIIHGRESKHDVHSRSTLPCLAIEPLMPEDRDPHRL